MPEGIVTELLIVLAGVIVVAATVVIARRPRRDEPPARVEPAEPPAGVEEAELERPAAVPTPEEVEQAPPVVAPETAARPSLRQRLAKPRRFLADRLSVALSGGATDETWDDLEAALIQADVGVDVATRIVEDLKVKGKERRVTEAGELRGLLAEELVGLFDSERQRALEFASVGTTVWLVMGVNGTGKTTTIGKLARDLQERGKSVSLAAADTFRAAADDQLGLWAERSGAHLSKHQPGADPGAVAFDAYQHAQARKIDVLIVDTAGRLHTKTPLMAELGKVKRVIEKEGSVQESLLVIDATAGQNGLAQAREFAEVAAVTGIALTKLDGTAKGGIALAIEATLDIPIKLIGVGEGIDDLEAFDPKAYVDALLT